MSLLLFTINPGLEIVGFLPAGVIDDEYTATLQVRGGLEPYTIRVVSALPAGLTATDNGDGTLTISGTPTEAYSGPVVVQAGDGLRKLVQRSLSLVIISTPTIADYLLWEDGGFLLWEDGGKIELG